MEPFPNNLSLLVLRPAGFQNTEAAFRKWGKGPPFGLFRAVSGYSEIP
jgi:hypothetical protein